MRTIVAAIAFLALASVSAVAQTQVDRPLKKVGDTCSYKVIDDWNGAVLSEYSLTISSVSGDGYDLVKKTKSGVVENFKMTPDLNRLSFGDTTYTPDSGYLAFPLHVGKTWEVKASYTKKTNGMRGSYVLAAVVAAEEKIGELLTLKITYEGRYNASMPNGNSGSGAIRAVHWYVPSTGCFAKSTYEDTNWSGGVHNRNTIMLVN